MKPSIVSLLRVLVIAFGVIFLVLSFLQWQTVEYEKKAGGPMYTDIYTQSADPGSIIHVKWSADKSIEVRVVKLESRRVYEDHNGNITDTQVTAKGSGKSGEVWGKFPSISKTGYAIIVATPSNSNYTIRDVDFTVTYDLWFPNYNAMAMGFILIGLGLIHLTITRLRVPVAAAQTGTGAYGTGQAPYIGPGAPSPYEPQRPPVDRGPGPGQVPPYQRGYQRGPEPMPAQAPAGGYPEDEGEGFEEPPAAPPVFDQYGERRAPPPAQPRYQPRREEPPRQMRAAPSPPPAEEPEQRRPIARIRCSACGEVIPIYSRERPQRVTCSNCGRSGTLR